MTAKKIFYILGVHIWGTKLKMLRRLAEGLEVCVLTVIILPLNVVSIVLPFLFDVVRARSVSV